MRSRLAVGALALGACLFALFGLHEKQLVSSARQDASETQQLLDQEDARQRAAYYELLRELVRETQRDDTKLSDLDLLQVRAAMAFFDQRIREPLPNGSHLDVKTADLLQMTQCAWLMRRFDLARDSLESVLKIYRSENPASLSGNSRYEYIAAENALGCLLVNMGRTDDALPHLVQAQQSCQRWLTQSPDDFKLLQLLSRATTNIGVTALIRREGGIDLIVQGAEIARRSSGPGSPLDDSEYLPVSELASDGFQAAGLLEFQNGRFERTADLWRQALAQTVELLSAARVASQSFGVKVDAARYHRACQHLEDDLLALDEFSRAQPDKASTPSSDNGGQVRPVPLTPTVPVWSWIPLNEGRNLSLLSVQLAMGSRLPAEFEHQDAILFVWPDITFGQKSVLASIKAIQKTTTCIISVRNAVMQDELAEALEQAGIPQENLCVVTLPTELIWARDFGPFSVIREDGSTSLLDSIYWHEFSRSRIEADSVPRILATTLREPVQRIPIQLDGGAILSNGDGVCLVSSSTIEVNAQLGQSEPFVTATIKRVTGAEKVIYLEPLSDEQTHHIDMFAAFTSPDTVVLSDYSGIDDVNARILNQNAVRVQNNQTRSGPLKVVRIPAPPREENWFGGSYTNVVFANGVLLVPSWPSASRATEQKVLATYQRLLPEWKIVPIECSELGQQGGALRCVTANLARLRRAAHLTRPGRQGT